MVAGHRPAAAADDQEEPGRTARPAAGAAPGDQGASASAGRGRHRPGARPGHRRHPPRAVGGRGAAAGPRLPAVPGRAGDPRAPGRHRPRRVRGLQAQEGRCRRAQAAPRPHQRPPGQALRRAAAQPADRPPGDGHRRQGRHHQGRVPGRQPPGLPGVVVQGALQRGGGPRLPLALPPEGAAQGHDPHLQPLPLRGRAHRPGQGPGPRVGLAAPVRGHQPVRVRPHRRRGDGAQVLPPHLQGRAEAAPGEPPGRPGQALEVLGQRPQGAGLLGRLPGGVRGRGQRVLDRLRPLVRGPGQQEVVPQPGRGPDHRRHPRGR